MKPEIPITQMLCILHSPSRFKFEQHKPYVLFISGNGPVGDKFNVDSETSIKRFPPEAAERFETIQEAIPVYEAFLDYVQYKIKEAKSKSSSAKHTPSYYLWT